MLKFGERYMLVISPYSQVQYAIGKLENDKFISEQWQTLDHGKDFYATNTFTDADEGYKLVGWIKVHGNDAWSGCLSLPRHVTLNASGEVCLVPAAGLQSLRTKPIDWADSASIAGNCLEIKATFPSNPNATSGLLLQDDERDYPLTVDFSTGELQALNEKRKLERFDPSEPLNLHIFIDHSVVEVFVNERESLATWVRPALAKDGAWRVRPTSPVRQLEAWQLAG
jgi:beta-fructofuranosidase